MRIFFGAWTERQVLASVFHGGSCAPGDPGLAASVDRVRFRPPPQPTILIETLIDSTIFSISRRRRSSSFPRLGFPGLALFLRLGFLVAGPGPSLEK